MAKLLLIIGTIVILLSVAVPSLEKIELPDANIFNSNTQVAHQIN